MKSITAVISIVGFACCAALLAFSANRPTTTNLNTALLTDTKFITHLAKYSKSYATMEEYSLRAGIFRENLEKITQLNLDHDNTVTFDVNHMADWTAEEYQGLLGFRKSPLESESSLPPDDDTTEMPVTADSVMPNTADDPVDTAAEDSDVPETIVEYSGSSAILDWRNKGVLNPIFSLD